MHECQDPVDSCHLPATRIVTVSHGPADEHPTSWQVCQAHSLAWQEEMRKLGWSCEVTIK